MITFFSTTWSRLTAGDVVKAPDGSEWTIGAAIQYDGTGEWLIEHPTHGSVWTTKNDSDPVEAARPPASGGAGDEAAALAALRAAFPLMEVISRSA